jgi:PAS domain S-box-containing protein
MRMGPNADATGGSEPTLDTSAGPDDSLATVVDALERLASTLPAGHQLFTAVLDPHSRGSDILMRDESGATSVKLGLADPERTQLAAMFASLRDGVSARPHPPADASPGAGSTVDSEPGERAAPVNLTEAGDLTEAGVDADPLGADHRAIVEECPIPLIVISFDGMVEYASPAVVPTLGVDEPAALEGLFLAQLLHPDDRERAARVLELSLRRLDTTRLTVRARRWDGSLVRVEIAARPLPGRDRLILALLETAAERSGIEEVLAGERRQRALAGAADAGIALVSTAGDSAGAVIDVNPQFGRLVGGGPGQLVGTSVWELVAHADAQRVHQALGQVIDGAGSCRLEARLDAEPFRRILMVISLVGSSGDPPTLATVLVRDITAQHGLGELNRTVERLERQNQELAEFARVTAHDLVAPLRALSGLMDVIAPQLEAQSEDALVAVQSAIGRMLAMVDGALGYTDAQTREPNHTPVHLGEVVDHVLATLGPDIVARDAEIVVGELPTVSGDDAQLERVFISLVTNALSYSGDAPPRVRIDAARDGAEWRIMVADQGVGVDPDARESIFRLFERRAKAIDRASSPRSTAGYGIGLATARQIVEQHGGRIWVEPNLPAGSVFVFTLTDP